MSPSTRQVTLEKLTLALGQRISEEVVREMATDWPSGGAATWEFCRDFSTRAFVGNLRLMLACQKGDPVVINYPATAWDHIKRDWIPTFTRWLGLPVRETTVEFTGRIVYPDIAFPEQRHFYRIDHQVVSDEGELNGND